MSAFKTAAWTATAVAATGIALFTGGTGTLLIGGAIALFSGLRALGSHKESKFEAMEAQQASEGHQFAIRSMQQERAAAIAQGYGDNDGPDTNWRESVSRSQGTARGV